VGIAAFQKQTETWTWNICLTRMIYDFEQKNKTICE